MRSFSRSSLVLCVASSLLASPLLAQWFSNGSAQIPQTGSLTEAVDFADIDGDGDWDAAIADGGDTQQDQDRLWVNQGGAQGGVVGVFVDVTAAQAPVVQDQSRDIEFADIDGDGDPDLAVSNEAQLLNQSCKFWCNQGGAQGGTSGFFANETLTRWVGLGGAGSSVPPSAVLAGGGFIDWTSDSDFADLDLDGDVDLFHSSHGGAFGGNTPSRVFLNDGAGYFSEFNPSGFQLPGTNIANGNPGLWCEGVQAANTTNATGQFCDVATSAIGVDLADGDGDFDVDVLLGSRQELPRYYSNRFAENGSVLGWRDVTGVVLPPGYATGSDNYEQEFGDMDGDGDVDLFGLDWPGSWDATFANSGTAVFGPAVLLPTSSSGGADVDLCDYDGDGTLDIFIGGFFGVDVVYKGLPGSISFGQLTGAQSGISISTRTLMPRSADVDHDGDYDVLTAQDASNNEILWLNTLAGHADTTPPYLPHVKPIDDRTAGAAPVTALAHVFDNSSLRLLETNDTRVELAVDGCALPDVPAVVQATQVAHAALPGNLVGTVSWRFVSTDEHGNTGASTLRSYTSTAPGVFSAGYGAGSPGSLGVPTVQALSVPFAGTTFYLAGRNAPPATPSWLFVTTAQAPAAPLVLPGLCNVNVLGTVVVQKFGVTDASGNALAALPVAASVPAGIDVFAQFLVLDGQGGNLLSSSAGLKIVTQ